MLCIYGLALFCCHVRGKIEGTATTFVLLVTNNNPQQPNRIDLIEVLAAQGGDLHATDSKGQTARDVAVFYSQEATVKYLSSLGVGHK